MIEMNIMEIFDKMKEKSVICPHCGRKHTYNYHYYNNCGGTLTFCKHCGKIIELRKNERKILD